MRKTKSIKRKSSATTDRPVCTWVPVTDEAGRTRMEARWTTAASLARSAAA